MIAGYLPRPKAIMRARFLSPAVASESLMVRPVYDMKTSSRDGRATLTERIATVSSANSRGTNCSPDVTLNVTRPS